MAEVSNRGAGWRWTSLAFALLVLDASLSFRNLWPTPAIRWSGDLSVELAAFLLLLLGATRRLRPPAPRALRVLGALWVVLVLSRYADVTAPALYGRQVNLYWDMRHVSAVAAMLTQVASAWLVTAIVVAAALIPAILYYTVRPALGRVGSAMSRPDERRALGWIAVALVALFAAQQWSDGTIAWPRFAVPVVATYARQAGLVVHAIRSQPIPPAPPIRANLERLQGADVYLVFIESYGAITYDQPEFAAALSESRRKFAADISATGREVVSTFVESPTFGGNSWLAHISLLSGVEVRDEDTNVSLMAQRRDTLVTAFSRQGYRTLAIMPGLHEAWPEGAFYGFNEIYDEERLKYNGPPFGWWSVPDQFVLARLDAFASATQPGDARAPVFAFFPTTNTHTPFAPTPPYQSDWRRIVTDEPFDAGELQHAWDQQPDWTNLGPSYVHSVAYTFQTIGGYLRLRPDRDFVMILIGDHQPPAVVSGEGATWEVPVHVIASRHEILESLEAQGFVPGLLPHHPALTRTNLLLPILLNAFSSHE